MFLRQGFAQVQTPKGVTMSIAYVDGEIDLFQHQLISSTLGLFRPETVRQLVERLSNTPIGGRYDLVVQVDHEYQALYVKVSDPLNEITTKHLTWMRGYICGAMGEMN
jgi:hypothetical protein